MLLCRLCEREVNEEGMGVHTACCETLRDADARAKATGGSAGHRLRAAAATAAALATDRGASVARAVGYAPGEPLMDDDEARAIARTCAIVAELAESELAESELAGSASGSSLDPGTPDRGTLRSSVAAELRDARERLDDMAAASWARGHHAAETVAAYLSAIVRRWNDVDAGGFRGFRRGGRREDRSTRADRRTPPRGRLPRRARDGRRGVERDWILAQIVGSSRVGRVASLAARDVDGSVGRRLGTRVPARTRDTTRWRLGTGGSPRRISRL